MSNLIKLWKSSASKQTNSRDALYIKAFTIGYIAIFVLLAVGFPAPYSGTHIHIPHEYLPTAIGIAFIFYVLLAGLNAWYRSNQTALIMAPVGHFRLLRLAVSV